MKLRKDFCGEAPQQPISLKEDIWKEAEDYPSMTYIKEGMSQHRE